MGRRSRRCRRGSGQRAALAAALRTFYSVTGARSCNGILRAYRIDAQWSAVAPTMVLAWFAAQDADGGIRAPIYPLSHCKTWPQLRPFLAGKPKDLVVSPAR
jgi:hypothetical protein